MKPNKKSNRETSGLSAKIRQIVEQLLIGLTVEAFGYWLNHR